MAAPFAPGVLSDVSISYATLPTTHGVTAMKPSHALSAEHIPDALRHFDSLPDAAFVRLPVVMGLFGCSDPSVWRMSLDGRLPAPVKLAPRITGWQVGALRAALAKASAGV